MALYQISDEPGAAKKFLRAKHRLMGRKGRDHDGVVLSHSFEKPNKENNIIPAELQTSSRCFMMLAMKPKEVQNGVVIKIRVKPHARRFGIRKIEDQIIVEVKNPPVKGKANDDVIQGLSSFFGKPVQLLKGHKSKQKIVLIQGITLPEAQARLEGV